MIEPDSKKEGLSALYYPETICLYEAELKYYLLLYDRIFFLPIDIQLNPGHSTLSKRFSMNDSILTGTFRSRKDAHYFIMYSSESTIWDDYMKRLMDVYDDLEEKGIAVALSDKAFENPSSWHPLQSAVQADMNDNNFVSLCRRYKNKEIFVPSMDGSIIKGDGMVTRPFALKGENAIFGICSERLNATLLFAEKEGLFPVSPYRMYIDLLTTKLKRISTNREQGPLPQSNMPLEKHKVSMLSWEITTEVIPQHAILGKSFSDILRYKSACGEIKDRFNSQLLSLESSLASEPWEPRFEKEIDKIVKMEILPEIQKIRDRKIGIWEKLFGDTLGSLSSLKILPPLLGLHYVPGLTFMEILTLSTGIAASATLPKLMDAWKEERQLRRHSLFFLVNFSKK